MLSCPPASKPLDYISRSGATVRQLLLLLPFALVACSAEGVTNTPAIAPSASADLSKVGVEHSITGSGLQEPNPGFKYSLELSVHSDASGKVSGQLHAKALDLTFFGLPAGTSELVEEPTCLRVVGNTAYVGLIVTKSTDPATFPVGSLQVLWMVDGGPNGADIGHGPTPAAFNDPAGLICSDTPPPLPADGVTHGNFIVR